MILKLFKIWENCLFLVIINLAKKAGVFHNEISRI